MRIPDIIDNRSEITLNDAINDVLKDAELSKMAVGYFFLSGFNAIRDNLNSVKKLQLLIGNELDKRTTDEIQKGIILFQQKEHTRIDNKTRKEIFNNTINEYKDQLEYINQTEEEETGITTLYNLIKEGRVEIKVYTGGKLHAKAYVVKYDETSNRDSEGICFVGSSNLTAQGFRNNAELNIVLKQDVYYQKINDWFDDLWNDKNSLPFNPDLINVITKSWIKNTITPYDLYLKTLYHLNESRIETEDRSYLLNKIGLDNLFDFQRWAFNDAVSILQKYDGVFIADVVGLGKSYIAIALMKYYEVKERKRTLIICPASLTDMWEEYCSEYNLSAKILSMSELQYPTDLAEGERARYSLSNIDEFSHYDIVVIDEAHNFRNKETQRYKIIKDYLEDRKVILLTATPQNKSVEDILNQFELIHHSNDISMYNFDENDLGRYRTKCINDSTCIFPLLETFVIRRRRKDIERLSKDFNFTFPRRKLFNAEYSIEKVYSDGLYNKIFYLISGITKDEKNNGISFKYSRYGLSSYLNSKGKKDQRYKNLTRSGMELMGLMKILLFKRFESSITAFSETVSMMLSVYEKFQKYIDEGKLLTGDLLRKIEEDTDDTESLFNNPDERITDYDVTCFDDTRLKADIENDINVLKNLKSITDQISQKKADDKIRCLKEILEEHDDKKILIFTEYSATANYIKKEIENDDRTIGLITGNTKDKASLIQRFAPKANMALGHLHAHMKEIDILVSTDVLSEGQNLQDASVVINYDIHWNPVRLIQRIGRVDRIGSENENILIYNFLPEEGIEQAIRLQERVQERINEIQKLMGEDDRIFTHDDKIFNETYTRVYVNRDDSILDGEDEFESEFEEGRRIILELKELKPDKYNYIKNIPTGVRCGLRKGKEGSFLFIMSGDGAPFMRIIYKDKIETNIEKIISELKCSENEPPTGISSNHKKLISSEFKKLTDEIKRNRNRANDLDRIKKYFTDRLETMYNLWDDPETANIKKKNTDRIRNFIKETQSHKYLKALGELKKGNLDDNMLYEELTTIFNNYDLESRSIGENKENIYKIICSEEFF